jgi:Uma2 family endonuclease
MILARRARPRKTLDDFMSLPEGTRAELIDGELFMCPSPREPHQWAVANLHLLLGGFVKSRKLGRVYTAPFDVHLPSGDIVEPDILFVAKDNLGIVQDWVRGAPDLVVEVLSPDGIDRDRFVKRNLYAQNGVREYWIVDADSKSIEVFTLRVGTPQAGLARYEPNGYFENDDILVSPLLPEFQPAVADLFAR